MTVLLLIRHGQNDFVKTGRLAGRQPGVHLNETGQQEAADLAQALAGVPIKAVYSSPLERTVETATPLANQAKREIQLRPGLLDTDVGTWENRSLKALRRYKHWKVVQNASSRAKFPGGESFLESQARLVGEIETINAAHKPRDIVAVIFHCDPIKLVIAHYLGLPLDHFQRLAVDTGSTSILHVGEMSAYLLKLNLKPPFNLPVPKK